jgi:hypothetical protein
MAASLWWLWRVYWPHRAVRVVPSTVLYQALNELDRGTANPYATVRLSDASMYYGQVAFAAYDNDDDPWPSIALAVPVSVLRTGQASTLVTADDADRLLLPLEQVHELWVTWRKR